MHNFGVCQVNHLTVNDAFRRHRRFHLLEKGLFSQEKVQMCENHQICRADPGEKNPRFFGTPPALKTYTWAWGVHIGGTLEAGFEGAQPLALIVALLYGFRVGIDCTNL